MSDTRNDSKAPIALDDVAKAVLELSTQPDLPGLVARFLELVRGWATPSAVLAAAADPGSEAGWRLLPMLCVGTGPLGTERLIARLVEETPQGLKRPTLVQPIEEAPGVRVRDNWIVPFWHEGESGVLVLRGVPRDAAANLGDALLATSAAVWPRLLGSPAARVEAVVKDVHGAAEKLQAEATRQLERLEQARKAPVEGAEAANEREALLAKAQEETRKALQSQEETKALVAVLETSFKKAEDQRDQARAELERAAARINALEGEQKAAAARFEELQRSSGAADAAAAKLQQAEQQRDQARAELERAAARSKALEDEQKAAAARLEELQRSAGTGDAAAAKLQQAEQQRDQAQKDLAAKAAALAESATALEVARAALGQAQARAEQAESKASRQEQPEAIRGILGALRHAAFVSDPLRSSLKEAATQAGASAVPPTPWLSVVLLDRDSPPPVALAGELEAAGVRVRLAREPEEVALLIRDPASVDVGVAICDITTFRPEQNVAGILRTWEKDKEGLEFYLSFGQDPSEIERARRVPLSLIAGHVQRPIRSVAVLESLRILARKLGKLP